MTLHRSIVRRRLTALIACSLIAATTPFSAQAASDRGLWHRGDGSFVPVDAVVSVPGSGRGLARYQETAPEVVADEWVDPATADPAGADAMASDPALAPGSTEEWVDPATTAATEPGSKETLSDPAGPVDAGTGEWVEPAGADLASGTDGVDSTGGEWVDPAPTTGSGMTDGAVDVAKDGGIAAAPETLADPATAPPVEPAPVAAAPGAGTEPGPVNASLSGGTEPWGQPIATAYIVNSSGQGAACHAAPEPAAETLAIFGGGEQIDVRGEAVGEWLPVNCAGAGGYVHTSLLAWTPTVAPEVVDDGGRQELKAGVGGGGSGGEQIVSFAMQYQGYPYVYAGEGPYAFDCSGFTMFVIQNTVGIDIPHDMVVQYEMGQPVSRETLQPGDLVFFANTFRPGMSHSGIYIGGGQFIHAETESSGVTVSDLNSDYYSSRWYGAVRFS